MNGTNFYIYMVLLNKRKRATQNKQHKNTRHLAVCKNWSVVFESDSSNQEAVG